MQLEYPVDLGTTPKRISHTETAPADSFPKTIVVKNFARTSDVYIGDSTVSVDSHQYVLGKNDDSVSIVINRGDRFFAVIAETYVRIYVSCEVNV